MNKNLKQNKYYSCNIPLQNIFEYLREIIIILFYSTVHLQF